MRHVGTSRKDQPLPVGAVLLLSMIFLLVGSAATDSSRAREQLESPNATVDRATVRALDFAVAIDGSYAVVGAEWADGYEGAAYILRRDGDGWGEPQKLSPTDLASLDHFGGSVAIRGDYAAVGAAWQDRFAGAVYVFKRVGSAWIQQQKLVSPEPLPDQQFARWVGFDGDDLVVAAGSKEALVDGSAVGHRFRRVRGTWTLRREGAALDVLKNSKSTATPSPGEGADLGMLDVVARIPRDQATPPALALGTQSITVAATDSVFEDRVEITWSSAGQDAIVYKVLRDNQLLSVMSSNEGSYVDRTGVPGRVYEYCVVVTDMGSNESAPVCDAGSRIIFAPDRVTASDGEYDKKVLLTWTDMSSIEAGYIIKRAGTEIYRTPANRTSFADNAAGLVPTFYEVVAYDADGHESRAAGDEGFRGVILPPRDVSASDGEFDDRVRITWVDQPKDTNELGYNIYRDGALLVQTNPDVQSYDDMTASSGVAYEYCVRTRGAGTIESIDKCDEGSYGIFPAPVEISASDSIFDDRVEITWRDPSDLEDGFEIRRDGTVIATTVANVTLFKDFEATPGQTHTYCVVAYSDSGGRSAEVCDEGYRSYVLAPYDVRVSDGTYENRAEIAWSSKSTSVVLFRIFRDGTFIKSVGKGERTYRDFGGTSGQVYTYEVTAVTSDQHESAAASDTGSRKLRAPSGVAATDDEHEDKVVVSWRDNSDFESGYVVLRENAALAVLDTLGEKRSNSASFSDTTAASGVDYIYHVAAFDTLGAGRGGSDAVTDAGRRTLLPPSGVIATDGAFEDRVEVTWEDNSGAEDGYRILRDGVPIAETGDNFTSYVDLSPPLAYTSEYRVIAFDHFGESAAAADSGATVILAPVSLNASDTYRDRVELTWVDASMVEMGYEILRDGMLLETVSSNATSFTDALVTPGTTYEYCVRAVLDSHASASACDTGRAAPPTGATATRQDLQLDTRVVASDGASSDGFGGDVAVSGDLAIVGAPGDDDLGTDAGAAYVYRRGDEGEWHEEAKLKSNSAAAGYQFGRAVAVQGETVLIGAPGGDAVYVFQKGTRGEWIEAQPPVSGISPGEKFGAAVAIDGAVAVIGAPGRDGNRGVTYILRQAESGTWNEETQLLGESTSDEFGVSVAVDGDMIVVGARGRSDYRGSAYVYRHTSQGTWAMEQELVASEIHPWDWFGHSVGIDDGRIIVGCPRSEHAGYVEVFNQINLFGARFIVRFTLDGAQHEWTSSSIALGGLGTFAIPSRARNIVVHTQVYNLFTGWEPLCSTGMSVPQRLCLNAGLTGCSNRSCGDNVPEAPGAAYLFSRETSGTWNQDARLVPSDGTPQDWFGYAVELHHGVAVVGANRRSGYVGSGFVFRRDDLGSWNEDLKLAAGAGSAGDRLGNALAFDGEAIVFGSEGDDSFKGSAYVLELYAAGAVAASDGNLNSRVRVTWQDRSSEEDGFRVYRDGDLIATLRPGEELYEDYEARPGRTHEYAVSGFSNATGELGRMSDFGQRPPNGNITGRIATRTGAGVPAIGVSLDPRPVRALLFDGAGGYVRIPCDRGFDFHASDSYTVEAWIKTSDTGRAGEGDATILAKGSSDIFPFWLSMRRGTGQIGFAVSDGTHDVEVVSLRDSLNDNDWHHVACVHDANQSELRLFIDGVLDHQASASSLSGDLANAHDVTIGRGDQLGTWFRGQIDEVRIWSVARLGAEIEADGAHGLTGSEQGLSGYWPMEEGASPVVTDLTLAAHYGTFVDGVYWTEDAAPLDIDATTDGEGNYVLQGVRYGEETTFKVRPHAGLRQFEPAFKTITLGVGHPVENQVDFNEISSFTVSGTVGYQGGACPAPDVEISVDGAVRAVTDKRGKFAVAVDQGEHTIAPALADHTFLPASRTLTVLEDLPGIHFDDTTLRSLSGRVGGGCDRYVGDVTLTIENDCMSRQLTVGAAYEIQLPPQKYRVTAEVVANTVPEPPLNTVDVVKFFQNLGTQEIDLSEADATLDFIYRAPLSVAITGFDEWIPRGCTQLTYGGRALPESLPVIPQGTIFDLTIEVMEQYGEPCYLDSGTVVIYDEIADREDTPWELEVRNGRATYRTLATTPSLIVGRSDSDAPSEDRSFQKAIRAAISVPGREGVASAKEWALVTGHVAPEGSDFVTVSGTEMPLYILRDPPGDRSYAYLERGRSLRTTIDYDKFNITDQLGARVQAWVGVKQGYWAGFGAGIWGEFESKKVFETEILAGHMANIERKTEVTFTSKERFSTSADDLFAGGHGDVFVGVGFNFIFSEVGVLDVEGCEVLRSTSVGFEPDSVATTFAYTEQYIENTLVPELEAKVDYYNAQGVADSANIFLARADNWKSMVEKNRGLKRESKFKGGVPLNRSFSAGADFSYFYESDTTKSYSEAHGFIGDWSGDFGGWEFETSYGGVTLNIPWKVHTEYVPNITDSTGSQTLTVGYVLSDDDIGDHFTVDIKQDSIYPSPVFDVRAGVSSCPYEPWCDPDVPDSCVARMVPRDAPAFVSGRQDLTGVPPDETAVFKLDLANRSPSGDAREYMLRLLSTSNPNGALVKANGALISGGLSFFMEPNQNHEVLLSVERGPTKYNYPDLTLIFYPPCEYAVWQQGAPLQRADTLRVSVGFDAPCSDVALVQPESGWTFTVARQAAQDSIIILIGDYELDVSETEQLEFVGAQFRKLGTGGAGPGKWTTIAALSSPDAAGERIAWMPPDSLPDGVYELRAFTECNGGERGYSAVATGTIDRSVPLVVGAPEPADGVLSLGEKIAVTYNEPIDCKKVSAAQISLVVLPELTPVTVKTTCDATGKLVLSPTSPPLLQLQDRTLRARVAGVRDLVGNPAAARQWEFTVRTGDFAWAQDSVAVQVRYQNRTPEPEPRLDPPEVTAELVNGQPVDIVYEFVDLPAWLVTTTFADTIPALSTQTVTFGIVPSLVQPGASYVDSLQALVTGGVGGLPPAKLKLYLQVECQPPSWIVDASEFQHSMTLVLQLGIEGVPSTDPNDVVYAFVGNQVRGLAHPEPVGLNGWDHLVFLSVYANAESLETVRFQVWNDDACRLYTSTSAAYMFVKDEHIGGLAPWSANCTDCPQPLETRQTDDRISQAIPIRRGWNWISLNLRTQLQGEMSPPGILASLNSQPGDIIKSQFEYSEYDPVVGWIGELTQLDNVSMYMLRASEPGTVLYKGNCVVPNPEVPVGRGWSWIGYVPRAETDVNLALDSLVAEDNDLLKSQFGFVHYDAASSAWVGDLMPMQPGQTMLMQPGLGYKLLLAATPPTGSFRYPVVPSPECLPPAALLSGDGIAAGVRSGSGSIGLARRPSDAVGRLRTPSGAAKPATGDPTNADPVDWSVDPRAYQYDMTLTADLLFDDGAALTESHVVAARVGDEIRGVARPRAVAALGEHRLFLMIRSNVVSGETVTFEVYDPELDAVLDIGETMKFQADNTMGRVSSPFVLHANREGIASRPSIFMLGRVQPNPFRASLITPTIQFALPREEHVAIKIFDVRGRLVRTLVDEKRPAGWHVVSVDGRGLASGIYLYRMQAGSFSQVHRMVVLR